MNVLLDTLVFVARETGHRMATLSSRAITAVAVVTVAELRIGVLVAGESLTQATRPATLEAATTASSPLPMDDQVGERFARLVSHLRSAGRNPRVLDTLIAATAIAHEAAVATQDDASDDVPGLTVLKV